MSRTSLSVPTDRRPASLALLLCLFFSAPPLAAQTLTPSDGLVMPDSSITTTDDASALEVNPAGLAFSEIGELGYGFNLPTDDLRGVGDTAHGLFLSGGTGSVGAGFGIQWLERPDLGVLHDDYRKYTLGFAVAAPRELAFGVGFNWFGSDDSERLDELFAIDLGAQWRPYEFLGLGLHFRDLNGAFLRADDALPTRVTGGLALRFWEGRLLLDAEAGLTGLEDAVTLVPRIAVEPISGLRLFGRSGLRLERLDDEVAADWQWLLAGLELSLGNFGAEYAPLFAASPGGAASPEFAGLTAYHWIAAGKQRGIFAPSDRWIYLNLNASIREGESFSLLGSDSVLFLNIMEQLRGVADDPSVSGVVISAGDSGLGYAQIWEVRRELQRIRDAGKTTIAMLGSSDLKQYYLATAADRIWMLPSEPFFPGGLESQMLFFKDLFQEIGVEAQFVRIGEFKSAPETFIYEGPSEENILQRVDFLEAYFATVVNAIATMRGKEVEEVMTMIEAAPLLPAAALEQDYVDAYVYLDEIEDRLREEYGSGVGLERGWRRQETSEERWGVDPVVAIVTIEGTIIQGRSGETPFLGEVLSGSETLVATLDRLRRDPLVAAVVLRVDSPGGSAVGSDLIFRQLRRLAEEKPVIASMGNVAASGGYYVAAGADEIYATPLTLTGSIGIFAGKFNVARLADWMGINREDITRGQPIAYTDFWEPWSAEELRSVGEMMNYLYRLFLVQVASTRPLTPEQVDAVGRGRVWTGIDALERELVDRRGGLLDAIRRAEELAGLEPGEARHQVFPEAPGLFGIDPALVQAVGDAAGLGADGPLFRPESLVGQLVRRFERALLVPLLFAPGEALMLPLEWVEID